MALRAGDGQIACKGSFPGREELGWTLEEKKLQQGDLGSGDKGER